MQIKTIIQLDITSHWSEWSSSKNPQTINAGEDVEKRKRSCTIGGKLWKTVTVENSMETLKKNKKTRNKTTI